MVCGRCSAMGGIDMSPHGVGFAAVHDDSVTVVTLTLPSVPVVVVVIVLVVVVGIMSGSKADMVNFQELRENGKQGFRVLLTLGSVSDRIRDGDP